MNANSKEKRKKDGRVPNLTLSSLTGKKEIQLTRGTDRTFSPQRSPNGDLISFFSSKPRRRSTPGCAWCAEKQRKRKKRNKEIGSWHSAIKAQ
jgi:hypothetical protein